jgi:hypothetical protein
MRRVALQMRDGAIAIAELLFYGSGRARMSSARELRSDECAGCEDVSCKHHGPMLRKLARRVAARR